jgi:hypothetical protein
MIKLGFFCGSYLHLKKHRSVKPDKDPSKRSDALIGDKANSYIRETTKLGCNKTIHRRHKVERKPRNIGR